MLENFQKQINVQDGIMACRVAKFLELINMQDGIRPCRMEFCQFYYYKFKSMLENFQNLINVQDGISACRMDFPQKRIRFAA